MRKTMIGLLVGLFAILGLALASSASANVSAQTITGHCYIGPQLYNGYVAYERQTGSSEILVYGAVISDGGKRVKVYVSHYENRWINDFSGLVNDPLTTTAGNANFLDAPGGSRVYWFDVAFDGVGASNAGLSHIVFQDPSTGQSCATENLPVKSTS